MRKRAPPCRFQHASPIRSPSTLYCRGGNTQDNHRQFLSLNAQWKQTSFLCLHATSPLSLILLPKPPPQKVLILTVCFFMCDTRTPRRNKIQEMSHQSLQQRIQFKSLLLKPLPQKVLIPTVCFSRATHEHRGGTKSKRGPINLPNKESESIPSSSNPHYKKY